MSSPPTHALVATTLLWALGCGNAAPPTRPTTTQPTTTQPTTTQPTTTQPATTQPAPSASRPWWHGGVDCHVHVAPDGEGGAAVLAMLDEAGLERACLLSPGYQPGCDAPPCAGQRERTVALDDWTLAEAARSDRLLPFCGIPIGYEWAADEMRRCADDGARGFKMHPFNQHLSLTDEAVRESLGALFEVAAAASLPVLVHVAFDPEEIRALYALARAHPATTIIAAHQLGPQVAMLLEAPDNVFTDLSGLSMITAEQAGALLPIWRQIGFERILFGSDWPHLEPSAHLEILDALPLTADERDAVARGAFTRATAPRATNATR